MIEYHKFTNDKLKLDQSEFHTKFHLTPTNNINYIPCLLIKPIQNIPFRPFSLLLCYLVDQIFTQLFTRRINLPRSHSHSQITE